ncbi:C-C motif chemokine 20a.3 [Kryptolebias marmoratus]|uniref:C-C motif chemokine n=1 Tax=Kryptolebias marmoratus TaxID=37003 RepID=A0A3Q2ZUX5_KRYMA|nr:C-C motif chemokine 20a.3 [Kryptolebias marmoratus]
MVSTKVTVTLITLVTLCVMATDTSAARPGCCRTYMKGKLRYERIKGYSVQPITELCPISAIIFHLKDGKKACADPAKEWVIIYVNLIRNEAQKVHQKAQALHHTKKP